MKKLFNKPEIDVVCFDDEEVVNGTNFIYTSGDSGGPEVN